MLQDCGQVSCCRVPGFLQVPPAGHSTLIAFGHQTVGETQDDSRRTTEEVSKVDGVCVKVLRSGDLPAGQTDRVDRVGERDRPPQVQQGDVTVQIFPPVVLRMDDDLVDGHDLLGAALEPGERSLMSSRSKPNIHSDRQKSY